MFRSAKRNIIFPQSEHSRFAGVLASLWGNNNFQCPSLPVDSFVKAVTSHDRGYGRFDTLPVKESLVEDWIAAHRKGFTLQDKDPVVNIVIALHIKRLMDRNPSEERNKFSHDIDIWLTESIPKQSYSKNSFLFADSITNFCDSLSFHFCFEEPVTHEVLVQPSETEKPVSVCYTITSENSITVSPWPFSVEFYKDSLTAYKQEGYPTELQPVAVPFLLNKETVTTGAKK